MQPERPRGDRSKLTESLRNDDPCDASSRIEVPAEIAAITRLEAQRLPGTGPDSNPRNEHAGCRTPYSGLELFYVLCKKL